MSLNFNWSHLDETVASAVLKLLNARLKRALDIDDGTATTPAKATPPPDEEYHTPRCHGSDDGIANTTSTPRPFTATVEESPPPSSKEKRFSITHFELTSLKWGNAPPFVEIDCVSDAIDFRVGGADASAGLGGAANCSSSDVPSISSNSSMIYPTSIDALSPNMRSPNPKVPSLSPQPSAAPADTLAAYFGKDGLLIRLHLTYGGQISLECASAVRHQIRLSESFSIAATLPMKFTVSNLHLDTYLNINLIRNTCRLWLDPPTGGVDSPISKLAIRAEFGDDRGVRKEAGGAAADGNVCIDDRAVADFILRELKTVLSQKIVAPHFVEVPFTMSS